MGAFIMSRLCSAKGQGLVEYALLLVLVALAIIAILQALGPAVSDVFGEVVDTVQFIGSSPSGAIGGVSARRWWWWVRVRVEVTQPSTLVSVDIIEGSGQVNPSSQTCSPEDSCVFYISGPSSSGTVRAAGGGGEKTASW
jgi:pilus assembly protein Flp/PilA